MDRLDRIEEGILALQKSQAKTEEQLKKTMQTLSNIGINLGHVAEEFFYYALEDSKRFAGIQFDDIQLNVKARNKTTQDEFDVVLYNGDSIGLIEVKHKVHPNDLEKLKTKKVENFKKLFPDYADYKYYLGIGGMSIPQETAEVAQAEGIAVLRQVGELMEIEADYIKAY
ncbi:MAG: hypothetical protein MUF12_09805 [Sediminibacterium sp.]|nr:hypothetical protein [Sediminibacterium sp.]